MPVQNLAEVGHTVIQTIERQHWLAPYEERLQAFVTSSLDALGRGVRNLLQGTWLGHPLHPVLTDVTIAGYTGAVYLDALDGRGRRYARAADASLALGLGSAVATAAAGLADWEKTRGGSRRTGLVHAALNTAALGFFVASLVSRRRGDRDSGRALAATGFMIAMGAAYLGGALTYKYGVRVERTEAA
jgi:uncharacterized membrane protein